MVKRRIKSATIGMGGCLYASLREFIATLKREGLLLVVNREVDPKFELNAVLRKIQAGPNLPVLFERVRGSRFPVISNTLGNYSIIARLLGVEIGSVAARWAELARPSSSAILKEHA